MSRIEGRDVLAHIDSRTKEEWRRCAVHHENYSHQRILEIEKLQARIDQWESEDIHESMECHLANEKLKKRLDEAEIVLMEIGLHGKSSSIEWTPANQARKHLALTYGSFDKARAWLKERGEDG